MSTLRLRIAGLCASLFFAATAFSAATHRVVLVSGEYEYTSALTLAALAEQLGQQPGLAVTVLSRRPTEDIPGLEALDRADLVITFIRRMTLPADQLARFQKYVDSGRPLVALRTSCHAFENWKDFDHVVLGGNYQNHYPVEALVHVEAGRAGDPLLRGVPAEFQTRNSLYRMSPLAPD